MSKMKTSIFSAQVGTPFGDFVFAVDTIESDARREIRQAVVSEFRLPYGLASIGEVCKTTRRVIKKMDGVKNCYQANPKNSSKVFWAWYKRA